MRGKCTQYDAKKGYGFLETGDGKKVFCHQSKILRNGFRKLFVGDIYEFDIEESEKGLNAINVQKAGKPVSFRDNIIQKDGDRAC